MYGIEQNCRDHVDWVLSPFEWTQTLLIWTSMTIYLYSIRDFFWYSQTVQHASQFGNVTIHFDAREMLKFWLCNHSTVLNTGSVHWMVSWWCAEHSTALFNGCMLFTTGNCSTLQDLRLTLQGSYSQLVHLTILQSFIRKRLVSEPASSLHHRTL